MAKQTTKPLAAAVGAAFMASVALSPIASAAQNPFQATPLSSGYNVAGAEGCCGEGKCGEGKCATEKCRTKSMEEGKSGMENAQEGMGHEGMGGAEKATGKDKAKEESKGAEGK